MSKITSTLNTSSKDFKDNLKSYGALSEELQSKLQTARSPETTKDLERLASRNKKTTFERVSLLVDPGTDILELNPFAGADMYEGLPPGSGIYTCIGTVGGQTSMIVANNPSVKGGTYFPTTIKKHLRAQEIALENHLPCFYLVDSGGAFLPLQAEVFPDRYHFGRIFYHQAQMSSRGIPQISVVLGSCTAGGAYVPAMSEQTVMVKGNGTIFLGGPPLVKAATGEEISAEALGGAEVHTKISGVSDYMAETEEEALTIARRAARSFGHKTTQYLAPDRSPTAPAYDPQELYGIVGADIKRSFSALEVLARLLDESRFDEFKPDYATTIKCGFGHIEGFLVGVVINDGILFSESALKATHFIELCNERGVPLIFMHNIAGFMVGKDAEHGGIAKHGAKMVTAVATSWVPKLSLIIGGSFGAGNYAMCGRAYEPRFLFSWPNSRISVMGGQQAANVLATVRSDKETPESEFKAQIVKKYETEGSPYYASARLWDDGIIDPLMTRHTLALALGACRVEPENKGRFGVFRM